MTTPLPRSVPMRAFHPRRSRLAATVGGGAIAAFILSGCTSGGGVDTSPEGQVAYACGLSEQITAPESWETAVGDDADPGAVAAQATISLLGGHNLYELPEHPGLTDAARELARAFQSFDQDAFDDARDDIAAGCEGIEPPAEPALDSEGQVAYACALASTVKSERGDAASWGSMTEDPAWHEAFSVAALVGAANGGTIPDAEELAEAATDLGVATRRAVAGDVQSALDAFIEGCSA